MGVHLYTNGAWTDSGKIYRNSLNFLDPNNVLLNRSFTIDPSPSFINNPNFNCTNFIPVVEGETYLRIYDGQSIGNVIYAFNSTSDFIAEYHPGIGVPFTIPNGVSFIIFNFENTLDIDKYMLAKTPIVIPYEPYNVVDWYTNNGHNYTSGAWT